MVKYQVYGLREPTTKNFRWVGVTKNLPQRIESHMTQGYACHNPTKAEWISQMKLSGEKPTSIVFGEYSTKKEAEAHESWLTKAMLAGGEPLLNRMRGREHHPETRANFSATRKGLKRSEETCKKFSAIRLASDACAQASQENGKILAHLFTDGTKTALGYAEAKRVFGLGSFTLRALGTGRKKKADGVWVAEFGQPRKKGT